MNENDFPCCAQPRMTDPMLTVPEVAFQAAADILRSQGWATTETHGQKIARAALEAAMPAIREAIARNVVDSIDSAPEVFSLSADWVDGVTHAAEVVRGGTE